MSNLKRVLNLPEVVFFAFGVILGAGIYTIIGKAAGSGGNMLWLSFSIAALTALFSLFAYAELISMYPASGGEYSFVKAAAGRGWATVMGIIVCLTGIISAATISLAFAGYFSELLKIPLRITALAIITFILIVNILGIKHSSVVNIIFTVLETCGLMFVIYSAAPSIGNENYFELPPEGINGLLAGAALCFFAFTGFEDVVKLAEETKEPEKKIPKGLFIAALIVIVIYLAMAISVVSMIPFSELASSESPLSDVVEKRFGKNGAIVIALVALFSTANSLLSNMLGASRVIFNIGKENKKMKLFSYVLPKRKTPLYALLLVASVSAAISLIGDIKKVALFTNFFVFIAFIIINITVIYLRKKEKEKERPFKIPLSPGNIPIISVVAIMMLVVLIVYTIFGLLQGTISG
jgi:basic amino acid/polyamine antiporter, APA family